MSRLIVWWVVLASSAVVLATKAAGHLVPHKVLDDPWVSRTVALRAVGWLAWAALRPRSVP